MTVREALRLQTGTVRLRIVSPVTSPLVGATSREETACPLLSVPVPTSMR